MIGFVSSTKGLQKILEALKSLQYSYSNYCWNQELLLSSKKYITNDCFFLINKELKMKHTNLLFACVGAQTLLLSFLLPDFSQAAVITFNDTVNYWTGYGNGTQDNQDVIGSPNITGGSVTMDNNGFIDNISFNHTKSDTTSPDIGDLFLDIGSDGYWDYVIDVTTSRGYASLSDTVGEIYSFTDTAFHISEGNNYILSNSYWDSGHRTDHPVGYDATSGVGTNTGMTASVTGPFVLSNPVIFLFSDDLINIGGESLTIGFGASCANDVLLSEINAPEPVPEPATMLLFGAGLTGLMGVRLRKKKKSE
jgi:PEP-CTERM motif